MWVKITKTGRQENQANFTSVDMFFLKNVQHTVYRLMVHTMQLALKVNNPNSEKFEEILSRTKLTPFFWQARATIRNGRQQQEVDERKTRLFERAAA